MRTSVLVALCLSTVALAAPTASASVEDACDNLGVCVALYAQFKNTCTDAGLNNELCSGDACDLLFAPSVCSGLRSTLYTTCTTGGYLGPTTCVHVSETPT